MEHGPGLAGRAAAERRRAGERAAAAGLSRRTWARVGTVAALAAPILMWGEFLYWGATTPGYSLLLRAASDLGMVGARHRVEFTVGFFWLPAILTVVLALALWRLLPPGWPAGGTALLVGIEGVALLAAGVLPAYPRSPSLTAPHSLAATVSFLAAAMAPVLAAAAVRRRLPRLGRASLVLGVLLLALFAADYLRRGVTRLPEGVFQRPFGVALTAWFVLIAAACWRLREMPAAPAGDGPG